jgi:hypothetical protein
MTPVRRAVGALVVLGTALVASFGFVAAAAAASSAPPYKDPNVVGYIGLCDQAGHQITSGNITTTPLASLAVSTAPAQAPYNIASRTATLYAYQPQQGLAPGEWSGSQMAPSSRYTNPANPMAAATDRDYSLKDFVLQYPPKWDGFVQLRMYLGAADEEEYVLHYPALNLEVTGDTWSAVGGGPVNCTSGTAESLESIVMPTTTTLPTIRTGSQGTATGSDTHPSGGQSGSSATTGSGGHPDGSDGTTRTPGTHLSADPANPRSTTSLVPLIVGLVAAFLLVLAATGFLTVRRRRRLALPPSDSGITRSSSTKGH